LHREAAAKVAVVITVVEIDLDKPHATLHETAGEQAGVGEGSRLASLLAIELVRRGGLVRDLASSGTLDCMRKAISNCWMRVWVSGSPTRA